MRARRPAPFLAALALLPLLAAGAVRAQGSLEDEIAQRRQELAALDRYLGHLRGLLAAASRGDLLLRDERAGLLLTVPRGDVGELARTAAALPAPVRPLARPSVPPGTAPDALVAALAAETRAQVDRELVPQIQALERARSGTAERIAWLEQEVQRRAGEARLAAEQTRKAAEERARIEARGLELVADRRRGPVEVWTGTRDGEVRLETVGSFVLRAPRTARPGDELELRLVQPGCCAPLTMTWRYPG